MFNLTISQFLVMVAFGALLTPLAISYVPHARRTTWFDLFLWCATWFIGFLGAWLGLGYWADGVGIPVLDDFVIADVPILPVFLGAAAGTFLLNVSLYVIDRIPRPTRDREEMETDLTELQEEEFPLEEEEDIPVSSNGAEHVPEVQVESTAGTGIETGGERVQPVEAQEPETEPGDKSAEGHGSQDSA